MDELALLNHLVIIGSWAEYLYKEANLYDDFTPNLRTTDIDTLLNNLRRPNPRVNLTEALKEVGYIRQERVPDGLVHFLHPDSMELEIMVLEKGRGQVEPYEVDSLGIKATGLRAALLTDNTIILKVRDHNVMVPEPAAYVLHKLEITRKDPAKGEKDIDAIRELVRVMKDKPGANQRIIDLYESCGKRVQKRIDEKCTSHFIQLPFPKDKRSNPK